MTTQLLCNNVHSNDIPRTISHDFIPRPSVRDVKLSIPCLDVQDPMPDVAPPILGEKVMCMCVVV